MQQFVLVPVVVEHNIVSDISCPFFFRSFLCSDSASTKILDIQPLCKSLSSNEPHTHTVTFFQSNWVPTSALLFWEHELVTSGHRADDKTTPS